MLSPSPLHRLPQTIPLNSANTKPSCDPRSTKDYCNELHEKKKQFFTQPKIPHRLQIGECSRKRPRTAMSMSLTNMHNYEMITYPRDNPFFSLHGPKYDEICKYFDPRLTQTEDILGRTIYQEQVFIDPTEEISASEDFVFESSTPIFQLNGTNVDLKPLKIGLSKTEDRPSTPELDKYRDALISTLYTKGSSDTATPKSSKTPQHVEIINSFIEEKSHHSPTLVTASRTKHPTDPQNSFIEESSARALPSSPITASTPVMKKQRGRKTGSPINRPSASRKKPDSQKRTSKTDDSKTSKVLRSCTPDKSFDISMSPIESSAKRLKKDASSSPKSSSPLSSKQSSAKASSASPALVKSTLMPSPPAPSLPAPSPPAASLPAPLPPAASLPAPIQDTEISSSQERSATQPETTSTAQSEITSRLMENSSTTIQSKAPSSPKIQSKALSIATIQSKAQSPTMIQSKVQSPKTIQSKTQSPTLTQSKSQSPTTLQSKTQSPTLAQSKSQSPATFQSKTQSPLLAQSKAQSPTAIQSKAQSSATIQSKAQSSATIQFKAQSSATIQSKAQSPATIQSRAQSPATIQSKAQSSPKVQSNAPALVDSQSSAAGVTKGYSLLETSLQSIRSLKAPPPPQVQQVRNTVARKEPDTEASTEIDTLDHLPLKDRRIARQLNKLCVCWIEEVKHTTCADSYGEFLITINSRYSDKVDMIATNQALSILVRYLPSLPTNLLFRTALFTCELLKILSKS